MEEALFEVRGLSKVFHGRPALHGIDLKIKKGETIAFLGPSGGGKTTLLRLLNTLLRPTEGAIFFEGIDLFNRGKGELLEARRKMVLLMQGAPLFNTTVFENLAFPMRVRGVERRDIHERVGASLAMVGLEGFQDRRTWTLSGGERQRVALAMAAISEPEVLLMDEPTSSLDPINAEIVEDFIIGMKNRGVTMIISTHKQAEAAILADRIAVINNGRIEQTGPAREIFQDPATEFVRVFTKAKGLPAWVGSWS